MAEICCGVVWETEPATHVDLTTSALLRRRLDRLSSIKIVAPQLVNCCKLQKRETTVLLTFENLRILLFMNIDFVKVSVSEAYRFSGIAGLVTKYI